MMAPSTKKTPNGTRPCSIQGINYNMDYVMDLNKKVIAIAGALTLSDTTQLWDLYLKDGPMRDIIHHFISTNSNIKASNSKSSMSICPTMMGHTINPILCPILFQNEPPCVGDELVTQDILAELNCLWFIVHLIEVTLNIFHCLVLGQDSKLNPYDLLHSWKTLLFFYWMKVNHKIPDQPCVVKLDTPI